MAVSNIIELRQLLRNKFPGLRTRAEEPAVSKRPCWSTGLSHLDDALNGGFGRGALTEVVVAERSHGSASLLQHLIRYGAETRQFTALVDGSDCFDPASLEPAALERLLWMRCHDVDEALKAADLVLRDGNLPLVLLDLMGGGHTRMRQIPAPTWYRFQRIVEERGVTCAIFTPRAMISPAQSRITLENHFDLSALEQDGMELLETLQFEVSEGRRGVFAA